MGLIYLIYQDGKQRGNREMSIKDFLVRVIKRHKTRGRPSKFEMYMTKLLSKEIEKPSFQKVTRQLQEDLMLYGAGATIFRTKGQQSKIENVKMVDIFIKKKEEVKR